MKVLSILLSLLAVSAFAATSAHAATTPRAWPSDSVYQLDATLTDQDGTVLRFGDSRGQPRLVTMFYSSCKFVCPLIIDTLQKTERELGADERSRLGVLMISLDPAVDTPAVLKALADKRHLDQPRWQLAHASATAVRRLAAVLGIQYRQLQDGEFSHSSELVLLDRDGRIVARSDRLGTVDPDFVAAIKRVLEATH